MAYCEECGAYVAEGLKKCPACGKRVGGKKKDQEDAWDIYKDNGYKGGAAAYKKQREDEWAQQTYSGSTQTSKTCTRVEQRTERGQRERENATSNYSYDYKGTAVPAISTETRILAACSYMSWLFLLPLLLKKDDDFVRFHLNQGLALFIAGCLKWFIGGLAGVLWLAIFVLCIIGIVGALNGKEKRLPFVGDVKLIK